MLTAEEIRYLLDLIANSMTDTNGARRRFGYSDDPKVARLQAKLSVMLEVKSGNRRPS